MIELSSHISVLNWQEARNLVAEKDPVLCKIIDKINPSTDFKLYKITYHYGDTIYANGDFYVPDGKNSVLPLAESTLPNSIKEGLSYQSIPLGFLAKKSIEVYRTFKKKTYPIAHRTKGLELGIWEMFSPEVPNIVTAGARSIFFLPKISDTFYHKRLRACGVKSEPPVNYFDQWQIFREISHNSMSTEPWECEILFFDALWLKSIFSVDEWKDMRLFLFEKGIAHTQAPRITVTLETSLNNFFEIMQRKRIKYAPHTIDIFKHLLLIISGAIPAFKPIENNEQVAPVSAIYAAYINIYGLKSYYPSMVYADYFNHKENNAVYYSLKAQTHLAGSGAGRQLNTFKKELVDLIDLIERFTKELKQGNLGIGSDYLAVLFNQALLSYFHYNYDAEHHIISTTNMHNQDKRLCFTPLLTDNMLFSDRNSFVNGCIQISVRD